MFWKNIDNIHTIIPFLTPNVAIKQADVYPKENPL